MKVDNEKLKAQPPKLVDSKNADPPSNNEKPAPKQNSEKAPSKQCYKLDLDHLELSIIESKQ